MKKLVLFAFVATVSYLGTTTDAHAWLKFKNNTDYDLATSHAYASYDGNQFCGYFDACRNSGNGTYRVEGWWIIAPGGTKTVSSQGFHEAYHQFYAFNHLGWEWAGGGRTFWTTYAKHSHCGDFSYPGFFQKTYRVLSSRRCCGVTCSPNNYTLTFN